MLKKIEASCSGRLRAYQAVQEGVSIALPFAPYFPLILKKQIGEFTETTITILCNLHVTFTDVDRFQPSVCDHLVRSELVKAAVLQAALTT